MTETDIETPEPADAAPAVSDHLVEDSANAPAPPPPPPVKKAPPPSGGGSTLLTVVLAAALAGGIYYTWTNPMPAPESLSVVNLRKQLAALSDQSGQTATEAATLTQQMAALSERLDKLEHASAGASPDLSDLTKRVDTLSTQLDALASRPAAPRSDAQAPDQGASTQALAELAQKLDAADTAQKTALGQLAEQAKQVTDALAVRLDKLEAGAGAVSSTADRAARLTSIQAAEVALQAGQKLGEIPGAPPALARFATIAPPTEPVLRESFPAIAAHAREVSRPDVSQKSFWQRSLTRLQQSVTVRQGDDVLVGDPAAGILADAEEKVRLGDLAGAVAALRRLQGPAADAVKDWADQAQALVDARVALASLAAHS
jgi:hypothetical protein